MKKPVKRVVLVENGEMSQSIAKTQRYMDTGGGATAWFPVRLNLLDKRIRLVAEILPVRRAAQEAR